MTTTVSTVKQVHRVFIKAPIDKVWQAITDTDWNDKYGYLCKAYYDLRPGGEYRVDATPEMLEFGSPEVMITGEIIECDPPRRLVQTWFPYFEEATIAEGPRRVTWELEERFDTTMLTLTHELDNAPATARQVAGDVENAGGGWPFILSDLKTFLESGSPMNG